MHLASVRLTTKYVNAKLLAYNLIERDLTRLG